MDDDSNVLGAVAETNGCAVATDNEKDSAGLPIVNPMLGKSSESF